jgi:hypothetical protein
VTLRRRFPGPLCLILLVPAAAHGQGQSNAYQKPQELNFHLEALSRQEWTEQLAFTANTVATSRRLLRARPRLEVGHGAFQAGLGGDFTYGSDHNLDPPAGVNTLAVLRDNYKSRDARLDVAWVRVDPVSQVHVQAGRFFMPVRLTEMIWDRDLRVQGASASFELGGLGPVQRLTVTGVYARGSQVVPKDHPFELKEHDTVWIGSANLAFPMGKQDRLDLMGAYVKFADLQFVDPVLRRQNTRRMGALALPYRVVDLVGRYHGEGRVNTQLVAEYCWNTAASDLNRGLWLAVVLGSTASARGSLEYTYAQVDKDATLAAYPTDDFLWQTGWAGHRGDLGVRLSDKASSHLVGQLQRFKDSANVAERDVWVHRIRLEVRVSY